ncbi:MAG TPA: transcription elongation factor GreA [Syntrophobacteraceae bacterium]|jgi:transcription elongation factor GreA|nr:transcription elongation factor GreA [Syntrophobacteraceae bacterium]
MERVPITRHGYRTLSRELLFLRRILRPQVLEELQEARHFGVKADNHQYLLAREKYAVLQRKITDLEEKLHRCEVVIGRKFYCRQVVFDAVAVIENLETGELYEYHLVGPYESDVKCGRLSVYSPVGRGLMECFEGDDVTVFTPAGMRLYRVVSIHD